MRLLLALCLALLPILPGSAAAALQPGGVLEGGRSIAASRDLPDEFVRSATSVGIHADAPRVPCDGASRAPTHSVPVPRAVVEGRARTIARGSLLELGCRAAARGEHTPYLPTAPPLAR